MYLAGDHPVLSRPVQNALKTSQPLINCRRRNTRGAGMLARPLNQLRQRGVPEFPRTMPWNELRCITKLADVPPIYLNYIHIAVQLYEAINRARKFHSRRDWPNFHFVPAIVGGAQTATRRSGAAGRIE